MELHSSFPNDGRIRPGKASDRRFSMGGWAVGVVLNASPELSIRGLFAGIGGLGLVLIRRR